MFSLTSPCIASPDFSKTSLHPVNCSVKEDSKIDINRRKWRQANRKKKSKRRRWGQEVRRGTAATLISLSLWCNLSTQHLLKLVCELAECIIVRENFRRQIPVASPALWPSKGYRFRADSTPVCSSSRSFQEEITVPGINSLSNHRR